MRQRQARAVLVGLVCALSAQGAWAGSSTGGLNVDCSDTPAGALQANPDGFYACTGNKWTPQTLVVGSAPTTCNANNKGRLQWDDTQGTVTMCNGTEWKLLLAASQGGGQAPIPPVGSGYFVMSAGQWNGNLGQLDGANAKCLADLTNNNWMGKADASTRGLLVSSHVRAFLCAGGNCNNALPNTTYNFAVSGQPTMGGATFTTESNGLGPNNIMNWFGTNYFGGDYYYWSGRLALTNSQWSSVGDSWSSCSAWVDGGAGGNGVAGSSNSVNSWRWNKTTYICNTIKNLICMVHP